MIKSPCIQDTIFVPKRRRTKLCAGADPGNQHRGCNKTGEHIQHLTPLAGAHWLLIPILQILKKYRYTNISNIDIGIDQCLAVCELLVHLLDYTGI